MSDKLKVFIVDDNGAYALMFIKRGWDLTKRIEEADLVQFTGGSDVHPRFYNEKPHRYTSANMTRDLAEQKVYETAQELGIPCAGICRGGQFLNVMNNGRMFQDVDGHGRSHMAKALGIGDVIVSSTHHQMMRPSYLENIILMTANESSSRSWMRGDDEMIEHPPSSDDVEAVYYPGSNCLCFQPHPEFDDVPACRDAYFFFINNYLLPNLSVAEVREFKED